MKSKLLMQMLCVPVLVSGCVKPQGNYCDLASPIYFESEAAIRDIYASDPNVLQRIVAQNEVYARMCQ